MTRATKCRNLAFSALGVENAENLFLNNYNFCKKKQKINFHVQTNKNKKEKLSAYILTFGESFSITPKDELFCKRCHVIVNSDKKYNINSHISLKRHNSKLKTEKSSIN
ncbi:hypothetical protein CDIK_4549 [Cucumispora dikerogammari]|nr:hypothetical protein CDIK_4549 [Cucumispora dikerogammari]